jgi:flagellar FliL protein
MAKTSSTPEETAGHHAPMVDGASKAARGSMLGKIMVLGLVVVVIAVECLVAYLCIPAASDSASAAGNAGKPPADRKKGEAEPAGEGGDAANVEVDLKEFSVTIYQPASNSTLRIDFHLYGIVAASDKKDFDKLFESNQNRFREQVRVAVCSAEMADLTEPGLSLIKRKILEGAKNIFGKPLLQELVISDYSSLEN